MRGVIFLWRFDFTALLRWVFHYCDCAIITFPVTWYVCRNFVPGKQILTFASFKVRLLGSLKSGNLIGVKYTSNQNAVRPSKEDVRHIARWRSATGFTKQFSYAVRCASSWLHLLKCNHNVLWIRLQVMDLNFFLSNLYCNISQLSRDSTEYEQISMIKYTCRRMFVQNLMKCLHTERFT